MSSVLVLAAHADDETLGCGGTLLRHRAAGDPVSWCIATSPAEPHWTAPIIRAKEREVEKVAAAYAFAHTFRLGHPAAGLLGGDVRALVSQLRRAAEDSGADTVYCVAAGDAHGDHRVLFAAAVAAFKPFRSTVRRLLTYETVSSTDVAMGFAPFRASVFVDIGEHIEEKLRILSLYESEVAAAPFPRSVETVRALAQVRGAAAGCRYAEAFESIRETR
jgi:N-acetylglucosamine malate deacetylase 1